MSTLAILIFKLLLENFKAAQFFSKNKDDYEIGRFKHGSAAVTVCGTRNSPQSVCAVPKNLYNFP